MLVLFRPLLLLTLVAGSRFWQEVIHGPDFGFRLIARISNPLSVRVHG